MNDLNEEQSHGGIIRGIAVYIVLLAWHPALLTLGTKGRRMAPVLGKSRGRTLPAEDVPFWQEATPLSTSGCG